MELVQGRIRSQASARYRIRSVELPTSEIDATCGLNWIGLGVTQERAQLLICVCPSVKRGGPRVSAAQ